jgi:CubicO group peptidase (beta-lactamase class C family)
MLCARMRVAAVLVATTILLSSAAALAAEPALPAPQSLPQLEGMLRETIDGAKVPGMAWAVVEPDGSVETAGIGLADVAARRRATADTLFRIGSISKMFVALAVLQLVEEGKLALDDRVAERAPDVAFANPWEATDPVRVANLLEHTTGFDDLSFAEYAHSVEPPLTLAQGLAFRPASRTSRWRPGTRQAYCNSGPAIAARVVEHVTGRRFEDVVAERIFQPLGMTTATYFRPRADEAATLYHADGTTPFSYWEVVFRPAGSVNASAREMAALVQLLLGRGSFHGRRLLSPASVERMEHPATTQAARAGLREGYGLADYVMTVRGFPVRGHNGGMSGALARLGYLPDRHAGFVFMINSSDRGAFDRLESLFVGYLTRGADPPAGPPPVEVPQAVAERFAGWYEPISPRREDTALLELIPGVARLSFGKDSLRVARLFEAPDALRAVTPSLFRPEKGAQATVVLVDDPRDGPLAISPGATARRIPAVLALGRVAGATFAVALVASAPLVALAWTVQRQVRRKLRGRRRLGVLLWPTGAAVCFLLAPVVVALAGEDVVARFGLLTPWAAALFVVTALIPFVALAALAASLRRRPEAVARFTVLYARAVALAAVVCAGGLIAGGWWAARTWV